MLLKRFILFLFSFLAHIAFSQEIVKDTVRVKKDQTLYLGKEAFHYGVDTSIIIDSDVKYKIKKHKKKTVLKEGLDYDTLFLIDKNVLVLEDTIIDCDGDSICLLKKGQRYKIKKDKTRPKTFRNDSTFYDSLHVKTHSNWITKEMYNALVTHSIQEENAGSEFVKAEDVYAPFEGKIIGSIRFKQVDVLEGSVEDTSLTATSFLGKITNGSHRNTRERVLQNYLVFDVGDTLMKYSLSDNERLLRQRNFIRDVRIVPFYRTDDTTVVDLLIITQDVYSLGIQGGVSSLNKFNVELSDRNLLGWGRSLDLDFGVDNTKNPKLAFDLNYDANNLSGTYIDLKLNYFSDYKLREYVVSASRGFITPETKYAGGVAFIRSERNVNYELDSLTKVPRTWEQNETDVWLGRSFLLGKKWDKNNKRKTIRLATRYSRFQSFERPDTIREDKNFSYRNRRSLLGSVSFIKINYYKEKNILAFGVVEDMPYGIVGELISGFEEGELGYKPYAGFAWGFGKVFKRGGYLMFYTQQGGFIKQDDIQEGVIRSYLRYFTPKINMGSFMLRPIVDVQFIQGLVPRPGSETEIPNALRGITADDFKGKSALSIKSELNIFAPWDFYGFRLALVPFVDYLAITDRSDLTIGRKDFAGYGLIVRLRNENLVFNSIQFGAAYYPNPPSGFASFQFGYSTDIPELFRISRGSKPAIFPF